MKFRYNARGDDRHANSRWVKCRAPRRPEEDRNTQEDRQALRCAKRGQEDLGKDFSQAGSREGQGVRREGQTRSEGAGEEDEAGCEAFSQVSRKEGRHCG